MGNPSCRRSEVRDANPDRSSDCRVALAGSALSFCRCLLIFSPPLQAHGNAGAHRVSMHGTIVLRDLGIAGRTRVQRAPMRADANSRSAS